MWLWHGHGDDSAVDDQMKEKDPCLVSAETHTILMLHECTCPQTLYASHPARIHSERLEYACPQTVYIKMSSPAVQ
jgi:hypothetical protein